MVMQNGLKPIIPKSLTAQPVHNTKFEGFLIHAFHSICKINYSINSGLFNFLNVSKQFVEGRDIILQNFNYVTYMRQTFHVYVRYESTDTVQYYVRLKLRINTNI